MGYTQNENGLKNRTRNKNKQKFGMAVLEARLEKLSSVTNIISCLFFFFQLQ